MMDAAYISVFMRMPRRKYQSFAANVIIWLALIWRYIRYMYFRVKLQWDS